MVRLSSKPLQYVRLGCNAWLQNHGLTVYQNIDRRPPTLLKQFTLLQTGPSAVPTTPEHLYLLPNPSSPGSLTLVTSPPLMAYRLNPLPFFDARADGLMLLGNVQEMREGSSKLTPRRLSRFIRTPDGEGLGIIREDGTVEVCKMGPDERSIGFLAEVSESKDTVTQMIVLQGGMLLVCCGK